MIKNKNDSNKKQTNIGTTRLKVKPLFLFLTFIRARLDSKTLPPTAEIVSLMAAG